jgi:thiol:disulfide interchange protein
MRPGDSRRTPLLLIAAATLLLASRIGVTLWEGRHPAGSADLVRWVPYAEAAAVAERTGKPILYEFSAEWCGPCQNLRRDVFAHPVPAGRLQAMVVPVSVVDRVQEEGHNSPVVDSLQHAFSVDGFPTLVIYWPGNGRSVVTSGYGGPDATLQWIAQGTVEVRSAAGAQGPRH